MFKAKVPAALVALALPFGSVTAADLARSGEVDLRWQQHLVQTIKDLDTSEGMKAYVNEGFIFTQSATSGGLLDGATGRCVGYGHYSDKTFAGREDGTCTFSDADKDQVFETYSVSSGGGDAPWTGTGRLDGGTGKYEGMRGEFAIESGIVSMPAEGHQMIVGSKKGTYEIGAKTAAN